MMQAFRLTPVKLLIVAALLALGLSACAQNRPLPQPSGAETTLAPVQELEILKLAEPEQDFRVVLRGDLPNGCTKLSNLAAEQTGQTFTLTLSANQLTQAECPTGSVPYERIVALDTQDLPPGTYTVIANGVSGRFTVTAPEPTREMAAADRPAATSESVAAPSDAENDAPEADPTADSGAAAEETALTSEGSNGQASGTSSEGPTLASTGQDGSSNQAAAGGSAAGQTASGASSPAQTAGSSAAGNQADGAAQGGQGAQGSPTAQDGADPNACTDKAAFYGDVTIPDDTLFRQGDTFVKTWRVRNEGTCTWEDYQLVFAGGEPMSGELSAAIPRTGPGEIVEVSVNMTAPTGGGTFVSKWELQNSAGQRFGIGINGRDPVYVRIIVNFVQSDSTPVITGACVTGDPAFDQQVLSLINGLRSIMGLEPVEYQSQLSAAAHAHNRDMACTGSISHTGSDGSRWQQRVQNQGYAYTNAMEIIFGATSATPDDALAWWRNSATHYSIMLNPDLTEAGAAYEYNSNHGIGYYTVVFGIPAEEDSDE